MIQMFNFVTQSWESNAFSGVLHLKAYNMGVWIDDERSQIWGLRSGETLIVGQIEIPKEDADESARLREEFKAHRHEYLTTTRRHWLSQV
jgi:hypothetical protein